MLLFAKGTFRYLHSRARNRPVAVGVAVARPDLPQMGRFGFFASMGHIDMDSISYGIMILIVCLGEQKTDGGEVPGLVMTPRAPVESPSAQS